MKTKLIVTGKVCMYIIMKIVSPPSNGAYSFTQCFRYFRSGLVSLEPDCRSTHLVVKLSIEVYWQIPGIELKFEP